MKKKRILLVLAAVLVMIPVIAWVGFRIWARHAGSWAVTGLMSDEQLIAICQEALECEQGQVPEHIGAAVVRMEEIDPKLASAVTLHLGKISNPESTLVSWDETPFEDTDALDYPGLLRVLDENGLHYEYYDESEPEPEPFVDSWAVTEHMTDEELVSIVEDVIQCEQGDVPDHAFAAIVRMGDIDPELSAAATKHLMEISPPAEAPVSREDAPSTYSNLQGSEPDPFEDLFGVYVRDGNGGHYEYYDFAGKEAESEPEGEYIPEGDGLISPQNTSDIQEITNPKGSRETSNICYIFSKKGRQSQVGTGFFLNNTVVCTAAHVIYCDNWSKPFDFDNYGWADEVYIVQAFEPDNKEGMTPYGQIYANNGDMNVGAKWKPSPTNAKPFGNDADWGIFSINGKRGGSYSVLSRKQIAPKTYYPQNIRFYGYPGASTMLRIKGRTAAKPSNLNTYRVLYATNSTGGPGNGESGMSGGPALDANGNIIGLFLGMEDKASPKRSKILGMDVDLYNFLSKYK